jgi:c-di-GMP-binding flagellar brake protein YcgR
MFSPSSSDLHPKQRRSPRFPFDSLVCVSVFRLGEETQLWGHSTDLCREGIGMAVAGDLTPEELVEMQIPLPAKAMNVRASVRYRNQLHCGFEFVDLRDRQRRAIQSACERLRTRLKSGQR